MRLDTEVVTVATIDPARKRVVIAEDEALIRMDLAEMLRRRATTSSLRQARPGETAVKLGSIGPIW
jgi:hypothetical protein